MTFDWAKALATCYAPERRLVEESEPEAIVQLTPAKLRKRAAKAAELAATWRDLARRFAEAIQGQASRKDLAYLAMMQNKATLFGEAQRRFQECLLNSLESPIEGQPPKRKRQLKGAKGSEEPAGRNSADELIAQLHKLRFFEGYTESAIPLAEERIRKQYAEGLSGPLSDYFERFAGFALAFISIDDDWYSEPYEPLVEIVAENSFGMFKPTSIKDERNPDKGTAKLSFVVKGRKYSETVTESRHEPPAEFLELIEQAFADHCRNLHFHETFLCAAPGASGGTSWTICTPRALKAIEKARLIPSEPGET